MIKTLKNLLPENAQYLGDFYKEDGYYFFTILVPNETTVEFKTKEFEIVAIMNEISVYVKLKISADYLEFLQLKS